MRPVRENDIVTASGRLSTGKDGTYEVAVTNQDGVPVITGTLTSLDTIADAAARPIEPPAIRHITGENAMTDTMRIWRAGALAALIGLTSIAPAVAATSRSAS